MKELYVGKNDAGQRLDRFLLKSFPSMPASLVQKGIRLKKIRLNGTRAGCDTRISEGDLVRLYISDGFLSNPNPESAWKRLENPDLSILYEDDNLLLIDKKPGVSVQPDQNETVNTIASRLKAYLFLNGEWNPEDENAFAPALCNRIDRNTGGIVIAAKNAEALRILNAKIKAREIKKYYLCIIHGAIKPPSGRLTFYLKKDESRNLVRIFEAPEPGALEAVTLYNTIMTQGGLSLMECQLITGRTHQIRASFAYRGHPLLGDGKYGRESQNRPYRVFSQALLSYKIIFDFKTPAGILSYLDKKTFSLDTSGFKNWFDTLSSQDNP